MGRNCWEVMGCGRQPGGDREHESGPCPAAIDPRADGVNHGRNAGRVCWAIAGTLCEAGSRGSFAGEQPTCLACRFYELVRAEEGDGFQILLPPR